MADIRTRDITRGTIKSLDRAASSMHRMKEQSIRSKSQDFGRQNDDDSVSSYAQDMAEQYFSGSTVFAAEAGMKLATRGQPKLLGATDERSDNEMQRQQAS